jgi:hypothetical protein
VERIVPRILVDPHADPAPMADIGRPEELRRVLRDQRLLATGRGRTPERQPVGAVMVIVHRHELLGHLGQGEGDAPQLLDRVVHLASIHRFEIGMA